jgi:hypothetical protein
MGGASAAVQELSWQTCWQSDADDHNGHAVRAMVYCPTMPGLESGDGHAGWLISASHCLLNLWECSASGGRGEASVQVALPCAASRPAWCSACPSLLAVHPFDVFLSCTPFSSAVASGSELKAAREWKHQECYAIVHLSWSLV